MQGTIVNFRRGRRTQKMNQMIILVEGTDSKEKAEKLVGKIVKWNAPGKQKKIISGKISAPHGGKGSLRVLFEKGMPGQSIGQKVEIT